MARQPKVREILVRIIVPAEEDVAEVVVELIDDIPHVVGWPVLQSRGRARKPTAGEAATLAAWAEEFPVCPECNLRAYDCYCPEAEDAAPADCNCPACQSVRDPVPGLADGTVGHLDEATVRELAGLAAGIGMGPARLADCLLTTLTDVAYEYGKEPAAVTMVDLVAFRAADGAAPEDIRRAIQGMGYKSQAEHPPARMPNLNPSQN